MSKIQQQVLLDDNKTGFFCFNHQSVNVKKELNTRINRMKEHELAELTDEALLEIRKKTKTSYLFNAVLIGLFIGVAAYSTFKKGFGFFTVFPLFFVFTLVKKGQDYKAIEREVKQRNLK